MKDLLLSVSRLFLIPAIVLIVFIFLGACLFQATFDRSDFNSDFYLSDKKPSQENTKWIHYGFFKPGEYPLDEKPRYILYRNGVPFLYAYQ